MYTGILKQSDAVSCHFGFSIPGRVNFRSRAIFPILALIIGKEDIVVGILGLNKKDDRPWDPTDETNFQWKPRSRMCQQQRKDPRSFSLVHCRGIILRSFSFAFLFRLSVSSLLRLLFAQVR